MTCCTGNNCISCLHCGSAYDWKGFLYLQRSWDTSRKIFDLPSFTFNLFSWLPCLYCGNLCHQKLQHLVTFPFTNKGCNWTVDSEWHVVKIIVFVEIIIMNQVCSAFWLTISTPYQMDEVPWCCNLQCKQMDWDWTGISGCGDVRSTVRHHSTTSIWDGDFNLLYRV